MTAVMGSTDPLQEMILTLKQTDYSAVKHLYQDIFDLSEDPHFIEAWRQRDTESSIGCFDRGVLVGAAIVGKSFLKYIFVHKNYQSEGIGSQLLRAVLRKMPNIHLTPVSDPKIQAWYIKHGFNLSYEEGEYRIFTRHTHNLRSLI
jgi:GNAT superfamily N-acetyltransferase